MDSVIGTELQLGKEDSSDFVKTVGKQTNLPRFTVMSVLAWGKDDKWPEILPLMCTFCTWLSTVQHQRIDFRAVSSVLQLLPCPSLKGNELSE